MATPAPGPLKLDPILVLPDIAKIAKGAVLSQAGLIHLQPNSTMKIIAFCLTCLVATCAVSIPEGTTIGVNIKGVPITVTK